MTTTTESTGMVRESVRGKLPEFLLAECQHAEDALLRNEESGEKRATFFVTFAGAVGTAFAFAFGGQTALIAPAHAPLAAFIGAMVLLLLGMMTTRRIIEQRIVTDQHIFALRDFRRQFVSKQVLGEMPNAFFKLDKPVKPRSFNPFSIGKGGWFESVAFVNAVLAAVAAGSAALRWTTPGTRRQLGAIAAAFVITWVGQTMWARWLTSEEFAPRNDNDIRKDLEWARSH